MRHWYHHKNKGQAILTAVVIMLFGSLALVGGMVSPVVRDLRASHNLAESRQSFYAADAVLEDANYRLAKGVTIAATNVLAVGNAVATATVSDTLDGKSITITAATEEDIVRGTVSTLSLGTGIGFNFAVQSGAGGTEMENSSSIAGNVFSNGPIEGAGSNVIGGDAVSAGPNGRIEGVHATSSAYAHTITSSTIDKDAYYQVISGTSVGGTSYPGSADQATSSLPISDEQIEEWKADAEAGGVISSPCPYQITANITIGPKKINCDLEISGSPTVTLTGALWVVGNIDFKNSTVVQTDASLGNVSVPLVADNPLNRTTSSKIIVQNSSSFIGLGGNRSYVLLVSQNQSAEQGGNEAAINVKNSANGALLVYAGHGEIKLQNNINLREVTAYRIRLQNSAKVIYEIGLPNLLFTSGPSGSYSIGGWGEL